MQPNLDLWLGALTLMPGKKINGVGVTSVRAVQHGFIRVVFNQQMKMSVYTYSLQELVMI